MVIRENCSLKTLNTFGIDISARYLAELDDAEEFREILSDTHFTKLNRFVLGGGSNILFTKDFDGIILKNTIRGISVLSENDEIADVSAGAGVVWHDLVTWCISKGFGGIENLSLIPGCAGAAPIQNIGAYGAELKDVFLELEALNLQTLERRIFNKSECAFGYRDSYFKHSGKEQYAITSITLRLKKKSAFNTSYGAIEEELRRMNVKDLSIQAISTAVCNIRRSKLPDPAVTGNAGSFFKNPVVPKTLFEKLQLSYPGLVSYPQNDTEVKLAAGWLIEQCGWKGFREGDAGVHPKQALVLVNYGKARGSDILLLSDKIYQSVKDKFGVTLEREVNIL